ncbi:hypothetical protein FQR65_LT08618 [Abscondita terminalis]|nr:hypothetical protein FQR65_LT08618 [Abscondita terminalis]
MMKIHWLFLLQVCNTIAINQLGLCVKKVMSQIFDERSTVVNSFIDRNMITNINEVSHIVVNISKEVKGVYDKYATSYILQAKTINMIRFSLDNILNGYLSNNWYQSKMGRFIIITEEKNISAVFEQMWAFLITDLVVLHHDDANEELIIYMSNQFLKENECGRKANKIEAQKCSSNINITFPKIIKNYNTCSFLYGVFYDLNFINEMTPLMLSIKLTLAEIKNMLNITIYLKKLAPNEHNTIKKQFRRYFTSSLIHFNSDVMTNIFFYDDLLWFGTKAGKRLNTFFVPFLIETWILIFVVFVLIVLIWRQGLVFQKLNINKIQALFNSFSQTSSLLFGVGLPVIPKPICIKFIILPYLFYIIHIQTAYTSDLTNNLVVPQYEHVINNVEDLAKSDVPIFILNKEHEAYFINDVENFDIYNKIRRKLIKIEDVGETENYNFKSFFVFLPKHLYNLLQKQKAAKDGLIEVLKETTRRDCNGRDEQGMTPTLYAAFYGHLEALRLLCARGGDPDKADYFGNTALHLAAAQGHKSVVTFLVNFGANIYSMDIDEHTPQELAGINNRDEILRYLDNVTGKLEATDKKKAKTFKDKAKKDMEKRIKEYNKRQAKQDAQAQKYNKRGNDFNKPSSLINTMKLRIKSGSMTDLRASGPIAPRPSFSAIISGGTVSGFKGVTGTVHRKILANKNKLANDDDFKISEIEDGKRSIRSLSGLRRDSEVMLGGTLEYSRRGRLDNVFNEPDYADSTTSETNNTTPSVANENGLKRSVSQPDFMQQLDGDNSLRQEPASIFVRPGIGSLAFIRSTSNTLQALSVPDEGSIGSNSSLQRPYTMPSFEDETLDSQSSDDESNTPLERFLEAWGLSEYLHKFEKEKINLNTLMLLTESDLKSFNLPLGPHRQLEKAIAERKFALQNPGEITDGQL